jgi:YcxB-like protein
VVVEPGSTIEPLRLTFTLSRDEFVSGKQRGRLRSPYFWILLVTTLGIGVHFSIRWQRGGSSDWFWLLSAICVGWAYMYFRSPRQNFNRSPIVRHERTLVLDGDGLTEDWGSGSYSYRWDQFRVTIAFPDMYVLQYRDNQSLVPKRAFQSGNEQRFRKFVTEHMKIRSTSR